MQICEDHHGEVEVPDPVTVNKWRPFYEAQKGVEISVELYTSTHAIHAFHGLQADSSPFISLSQGVGVDNAMRDYWGQVRSMSL